MHRRGSTEAAYMYISPSLGQCVAACVSDTVLPSRLSCREMSSLSRYDNGECPRTHGLRLTVAPIIRCYSQLAKGRSGSRNLRSCAHCQ